MFTLDYVRINETMIRTRDNLGAAKPNDSVIPSFRSEPFITSARSKDNKLFFGTLYSDEFRLPSDGVIEWNAACETDPRLHAIYSWSAPQEGLVMPMTMNHPTPVKAEFSEPVTAMEIMSFSKSTIVQFGNIASRSYGLGVEPVDVTWQVSTEAILQEGQSRLVSEHLDVIIAGKIGAMLAGNLRVIPNE